MLSGLQRFMRRWHEWYEVHLRVRVRGAHSPKPPELHTLHDPGPLLAKIIGAYIVIALLVIIFLASLAMPSKAHAQPLASDRIPAAAQAHRLTLKREAQRVWGLEAPVASFAAQIHQESRWRADAVSPVGAQGMAQFMPATATWISGLYGSLGDRAPMNPTWAIRALVQYDRWIWERIPGVPKACEHMGFTMQSYNGGLGWVYKRQAKSKTPAVCFGATCTINPGIDPASQREAQDYPVVILKRFEPLYATWGPGVCS